MTEFDFEQWKKETVDLIIQQLKKDIEKWEIDIAKELQTSIKLFVECKKGYSEC